MWVCMPTLETTSWPPMLIRVGIGVKVAGVGSRDFSVIGVGAGVEVMNFLATVVGVGIGVRTLVWSRSDWTD